MFCSNCGQQIPDGARFCPNCGQEVAGVVVTPVNPINSAAADYSIVLLGCGVCDPATARDLVSDLLGYTDAQATELIRSVPVEIACGLNAQQVMAVSQALTEYGLQVSIRNEKGYVDFNASATGSVFNESGTILQNVMNVLGTLTLANRVRKISRWTIDDPFRFIFAPRYRRPAPPRYARHFRRPAVRRAPRSLLQILTRPAPKRTLRPAARPAPAPRTVVPSRPAMAPRLAVKPRTAVPSRPAMAPRPAAGPRPTGGLFGKAPNRPGSGRGGRGPGRP